MQCVFPIASTARASSSSSDVILTCLKRKRKSAMDATKQFATVGSLLSFECNMTIELNFVNMCVYIYIYIYIYIHIYIYMYMYQRDICSSSSAKRKILKMNSLLNVLCKMTIVWFLRICVYLGDPLPSPSTTAAPLVKFLWSQLYIVSFYIKLSGKVSFKNFDLSFPAAAAPRSADVTPLMDFFKTQLATKFTKNSNCRAESRDFSPRMLRQTQLCSYILWYT